MFALDVSTIISGSNFLANAEIQVQMLMMCISRHFLMTLTSIATATRKISSSAC